MDLRIKTFENYQQEYLKSCESPEKFWSEIADKFIWSKKWETTLNWTFSNHENSPVIEWYKEGELNITESILEANLLKHPNKTAFYWEPNSTLDQQKSISYQELHDQVCQLSNALKELGVEKGDRVCLYMPMVIESVVAILACARIGAVHSIVFAGFSSNALADRINDAQAKIVITSKELHRGDKIVYLKDIVDEALKTCNSVQNLIVLNPSDSSNNTNNDFEKDFVTITKDQSKTCKATIMKAEDLLFILSDLFIKHH